MHRDDSSAQRPAAANHVNLMAQFGSSDDEGRSISGGGRQSVADLSRNFSGERISRDDRASDIENVEPSQAVRNNSLSVRGSRPLSANLDAAQFLHPNMVDSPRTHRGDNNNNLTSQRASSVSPKRDEPLPKHVAVSPQAFLKFFSL